MLRATTPERVAGSGNAATTVSPRITHQDDKRLAVGDMLDGKGVFAAIPAQILQGATRNPMRDGAETSAIPAPPAVTRSGEAPLPVSKSGPASPAVSPRIGEMAGDRWCQRFLASMPRPTIGQSGTRSPITVWAAPVNHVRTVDARGRPDRQRSLSVSPVRGTPRIPCRRRASALCTAGRLLRAWR